VKFRRRHKTRLRTPDDRMTLMEHLAELRSRIIKSLLAVTAGAVIVFVFYDPIVSWLAHPYFELCKQKASTCASPDKFFILGPLDGFNTRVKVSLYGGVVFALPVLLWQIWRFVTPGLHSNEKRYAVPFVLSSVALFAFGAAIAYLILPYVFDFLIGYSGPGTAAFSPSKYVTFVSVLMVAFGIGFEFPVVLVFLQLAGVVTPKRLAGWRRQAFVLVFVVAAVGTPSGDPYSLFALAIPMYIFYEVAIVVGRLIERARRKAAAREAAAGSGVPA
jgi:sec-independent protein translocase protein TatC